MKKLVVSGWINFTMLIPDQIFLSPVDILSRILIHELHKVDKFMNALYECEIWELPDNQFDNNEFIKGEQMYLSGDNGSMFIQLQEVDDFEVFF